MASQGARRAAAVVCAGLVWTSGWSAAASVTMAQTLGTMTTLAPLDQASRLAQLGQTDAGYRAVISLVLDPSLIETQRPDLEHAVGAANLRAAAAFAARLQIEARGDSQILSALQAPVPEAAPAELEQRFDGAVEVQDAVDATLTPARGETLADEPRKVHAITERSGRFRIDGREAKTLREPKVEAGYTSHALVHPDDPKVLVKIYHSPDSMDAFDRKLDAVERLKPLSLAGVTPTLLEHGAAPVSDLGMVYFFAQRLMRGPTLAERGVDGPVLRAMEDFFRRIQDAGLALEIPGSDPNWLLRHLLVDPAAEGGPRVYIVGAAAHPAPKNEVSVVNDMIRSIVSSVAGLKTIVEPAPEPEPAPPPRDGKKLASLGRDADSRELELELEAGSLEAVLARHGLPAATGKDGRLRLASEAAVAAALPDLLSDPLVARVSVAERVVEAALRRSAKGLLPLIKATAETVERDALLGSIPASVWSLTESADIEALLALATPNGVFGVYRDQLTEHAWSRLDWKDAERLIRLWTARNPAVAQLALDRWLRAHKPLLVERGLDLGPLIERLKALPATAERQAALRSLPGALFLGAPSAHVRDLLSLAHPADTAFASTVPGEAWLRLSPADLEELLRQWSSRNASGCSAEAARRWLAAHPDWQARTHQIVAWMAASAERDVLVTPTDPSIYAAMKPADIVTMLNMVTLNDQNWTRFQSMPVEAWRRLSVDDMKEIVRHWAAANSTMSGYLPSLWLEGHPDASIETAFELLSLATESGNRDATLYKLKPQVYAKASSAAVMALLGLQGRAAEQNHEGFSKFPAEAWRRLEQADLRNFLEKLQAMSLPNSQAYVVLDWLRATAPNKAARLHDLVAAVPANWRDWLLLQIPAEAYAAASGPDVASALALGTADDGNTFAMLQKLPPTVWDRLSSADLESALRAWTARNLPSSSATAARLWLKAHAEEVGKAGGLATAHRLLALIPDFAARDEALIAVAESAYAEGTGSEAAALIGMASKAGEANAGAVVSRFPAQAWRRISRADLQPVLAAWAGYNHGYTGSMMIAHWAKGLELKPDMVDAAWSDAEALANVLPENGRNWARVQAWPAFSRVASLGAIAQRFSVLPETADRDRMIVEVPARAYEKAGSDAVLRLLTLVSRAGEQTPGAVFDKLPAQAWSALDLQSVQRLVFLRTTQYQQPASSTVVARRWISAQLHGLTEREGVLTQVRELLELLPEGPQRDELIASLPGFALQQGIGETKISGPELASVLALVSGNSQGTRIGWVYDKVAAEAWQRLGERDIEALAQRWKIAGNFQTASFVMQQWVRANAPRLEKEKGALSQLYYLFNGLGERSERDQAVMAVPAAVFAGADGSEISVLLTLVGKGNDPGGVYGKLPIEAWRTMSLRDAERLAAHWDGIAAPQARIRALWLEAHRPSISGARVSGKDLVESLKKLAKGDARDEMILALPAYTYASLTGAQTAELLNLLSENGVVEEGLYEELPEEAWLVLARADVDSIMSRWTAATPSDRRMAEVVLKRWLAARG